MGSPQPAYAMGVAFYSIDPAAGFWIQGDFVERVLLQPLAGVLERCRYVSRNSEEPVEVGGELLAQSRTWRDDIVELTSEASDDESDVAILLRFDGGDVHVRVRLGGAALGELLPGLPARARGWVVAWAAGMPDKVWLTSGSLTGWKTDYPRPEPPRTSARWPLGVIAQYVGLRFHSSPEDAPVLERLRAEPLPAGATRTIEGDVLTLTFAEDLSDPARVAAARAAQEQWLAGIVETEPERGWNEQGDRIVIPEEPQAAPPLTLYDPGPGIGYKAIVVQPDGSIDEAVWAEARAILQQGALPDGRVVHAVRLIVPRREDAVAVRDRALVDGFEMVTYPRGQGVFWQVR
jgi:hypothetical protein